MKHKRSKATDISQKTKKTVWERDSYACVVCKRGGYGVMPNAHFVPRSKGGLGVEQNVVTLCMECHNKFDHGDREERSACRHIIREHLQNCYEDWRVEDYVYDKRTMA